MPTQHSTFGTFFKDLTFIYIYIYIYILYLYIIYIYPFVKRSVEFNMSVGFTLTKGFLFRISAVHQPFNIF